MTIPASEPKKIIATGNGAATVFSFSPMNIFAATDLEVTRVVIATGVETILTQGTGAGQYLVTSPTTFPGTPVTGSITYPSSGTILPATEQLVMKTVMPLEQQTDLENQGGYFADTQETQFDKNVKQIIQQQEILDRAVRLSVSTTGVTTELPFPVADRLIGWNATATALINLSSAGTLATTAFTETLLDDTDAEAFRDTLHADLTKGDLVAGDGTGSTLRTVGANDLPLVADSTDSTGVAYKILPVAGGGSGAATLTGMLIGNGTGAFTTVTAPTGAVVGDTDTQTLSGKTLSGAIVTGAAPATPAANTIYTDSIVKGWVKVTFSAGSPSIADDVNVSGVIDVATGDTTVTWDRDFSTADHAIVPGCEAVSGGANTYAHFDDASQLAGSCEVFCKQEGGGDVDVPFYVIGIGDN